jgi:hypothetical protein
MLLAFSGLKGSGKDTAAAVLIDEYGFEKVCFADALRESLLILDPWIPTNTEYGLLPLSELIAEVGWDWAKREVPEVRRLMQIFGTEVGRGLMGDDVWVEVLYSRFPNIGRDGHNYVITDCRFENEINFVHHRGGDVCWIERPGLISDGHASENSALKDKADFILHNDDTIEEFQEDIRFMMVIREVNEIKSRTSNQS